MDYGTDAPAGSVVEAWAGLLRRRRGAALAAGAVVLGLALAVVFLSRPVYRAEARLRLGEPPPMSGVSPGSGILGFFRPGGDPFANDLELIGSRSVAEAVVLDAGLSVRLDAPRGWHRDSLLTHLSAGRATEAASFAAAWRTDGTVEVRRTAPTDSVVGAVAPGERLAFGGVVAAFRPWREGAPRDVELHTRPFGETVRQTRTRLVTERTRRDANVVDLAYDHTDPAVARGALAAALDRFVALRLAVQRRESGETVDSLRSVAERTLDELSAAEARRERLQRRARLVAPDAQNEAFVERYGELVAELEQARAEREAMGAILERVEEATDPAEAWAGLGTFSGFHENLTVGSLLDRLAQLRAQRTELAARRTAQSRPLAVVDEQIAELDRSLRALARSSRGALDDLVRQLETRVAAMDAELARLPAALSELARAERAVRILSEVMVQAEQRLRQEELRQALTFANVQVIDPPALRWKPVWPRKKLGLLVGLILAAGTAALAAVVAERADRTVRRADQVQDLAGVPVLAVARRGRDGALGFDGDEMRAVFGRADTDGSGPPRLVLAPVGGGDDAASATVEALRARAAAEATERAGAGPAAEPAVTVARRPDRSAAAAAAAAEGAPVVLVVTCGRTRRTELGLAARLLEAAGGRVAGVVLLCERPRDAAAVWG